MDINLLSQLLKELILEHDKVSFISMGSFMAEVMPASISDRGMVINPPYRRLYYRFSEKSNDKLLINLYAERENISVEEAESRMVIFLREFREELNREKLVVFPGLGRMKASISNEYFFIADEDIDLYPDGLGLEPIRMKVLKREESISDDKPKNIEESPKVGKIEESPAEKVVEELPQNQEETPKEENIKEETPKEEIIKEEKQEKQPEEQSDEEKKEQIVEEKVAKEIRIEKKRAKFPLWLGLLLIVIAILVIFFFIMYICSDAEWVWKLLYNDEQLRILGKNF